jgi:hypothetical protein
MIVDSQPDIVSLTAATVRPVMYLGLRNAVSCRYVGLNLHGGSGEAGQWLEGLCRGSK